MKEYCVCQHIRKEHITDTYGQFCVGCIAWNMGSGIKHLHEFKLDNLKLVEDLAKERNLI